LIIGETVLELVQFLIEIYIGNDLASRQSIILPVIMAIQQCVQVCLGVKDEQQPIMARFVKQDGEILEYKNNSYIRFEEDKNGE